MTQSIYLKSKINDEDNIINSVTQNNSVIVNIE